MLILALDTSGKTASCALARDGRIIAEKKQLSQLSHSRTVLPMCEEMLREQGLNISDADLFAVTVGPGSFTGVRIGIAAVKGFAFPFGKPCAGVTTMRSAAFSSGVKSGIVCAAIRAREDEYYCAFFRADGGAVTALTENEICTGAAIAEKAASFGQEIIYLCGEGSEALSGVYPFINTKAAQSAAGTALAAFSEKQISFHELQPLYMKPSQAERLKKEINVMSETKSSEDKLKKPLKEAEGGAVGYGAEPEADGVIPAPKRLFSSLEEEAIVVTAENYRIRGFNIQYDDSRLVAASDTTPKEYRFSFGTQSPEDATPQMLHYSNCAAFTYDNYRQAFGCDIKSWTTDMLIARDDMLVFKYFPTHNETPEEQQKVKESFCAALKTGDIIVTRHEGNKTGHAMLYIGDGMIIHSTSYGIGGSFQYATKEEKIEKNGTVLYKTVDSLFDSTTKRFFFNSYAYGIARPSRVYKLEITENTKNKVRHLQNIYTEKTASRTAGQTVDLSEEITFTFGAKNYNEEDACLTVTDSLPENTEYVSGGVLCGNEIRMELSVPAKGEASVSYTVRVKNDESLYGKTVWTGDGKIGGVVHRCAPIYIRKRLPAYVGTVAAGEVEKKLGASAASILSAMFGDYKENKDYQQLITNSAYINKLVPTMYGGRYVVKSELFGGDRTRGILRCQLYEGDILLASDDKACEKTYAYELTANGVVDLDTLETKEGGDAQATLYSVLGCYKFAVLRPSMI